MRELRAHCVKLTLLVSNPTSPGPSTREQRHRFSNDSPRLNVK